MVRLKTFLTIANAATLIELLKNLTPENSVHYFFWHGVTSIENQSGCLQAGRNCTDNFIES